MQHEIDAPWNSRVYTSRSRVKACTKTVPRNVGVVTVRKRMLFTAAMLRRSMI